MRSRNAFLLLTALFLAVTMTNGYADAPAKAATCAACHGADGNSATPIWPKLAGQKAPYLAAQLHAFRSGARQNPSMAPMAAGLSDEEIEELAQYYSEQAVTVASIGDQDYSAAQRLYRGGDAERGIPACMACHGPDGAGNAAARYPSLRGQHAEYTAAQLKAYADGSRATDPNSMMRSIAGRLSAEDIAALSAYLSALH